MKILIIHNRYKKHIIGGEDLVFDREYADLSERLGTESVFKYEICNDDVSILEILRNVFFSKKHNKNISEIIKKNEIDIVHIHNYFPLFSASIFKICKQENVKVVHTLHNYRWWCISGIFFRESKGVCEECIEKTSFRGIKNKCYRNSYLQSIVATLAFKIYKLFDLFDYIDYFFALTEFQKRKIVDLGIDEKKIILKPNYISKNEVFETVYTDIKKDYLFIGRLEESKGIKDLIKVWMKLDNKFILKIIGSGPLENEIQTLNNKNIQFLGKMNNKDVLKVIKESRYLLQTSLWYETFGLTIIEAMSLGTPVIGSNIGTRKNFIEDEYNGFLYNENELAQIIEKSFDYPNYNNLSKNALIESQKYLKNEVLERQIEIYSLMMINPEERIV